MHRKMKTALSLLLVLLMMLALGACKPAATDTAKPADEGNAPATEETAQTTDDTATEETPADAGEAAAVDTSEFVSLTHYALGDPNPNGALERVQAKWNELLKEEINAELTQHWIVWAEYMTKYNLLLASQDPTIDMVESSSTWLELWQNADRGAWLELDDLLPIYAPKTWAEIPAEDWDRTRFNGKIVCFPENDYTQYVNHGFMYRGEWAEAAGLPLQLTTLEEFEQYCDWILENKPGVFPMDVDKGFGGVSYGIGMQLMTDNIAILGVNTVVQGASYSDPYTAVATQYSPEALEWAKRMKTWADKGYWRKDVLNNTASLRDSLKAGTAGIDQHHVNTFRDLKWEMDNKLFPGESNFQMLLFSDLDKELIGEPITHGALSIYAFSSNPERAVMAYETIRQNQDMYRLFNYGIEGEQYIINEAGQKEKPADYDKAKSEFVTNFWGGRVDRFELPSTTEWDGIYEYWKRLDGEVKPNLYSQFVFDIAGIDSTLSAISSVITEYQPMLYLGQAKDVEKTMEEYLTKLTAAGYDDYLAYVQEQLNQYKEQMAGK